MKHADKNEVDILLRGLAKNAGSARDLNSQPAGGHLDADELNAYAEDALPAAARARYTSHLADCSNCRKQVATLAMSAGVMSREAPVATQTKSFWQRLAPAFSPAVLKFAVPAIALSILITLGVVIMRRPNHEFVAQRSNETALPKPATSSADAPISENYGSPQPGAVAKTEPPKTTDQKEETKSQQAAASASPREQQTTATATTDTTAVAQPSYAPEVAADAPAPPPAPKRVSEKTREEEESKAMAEVDEQRINVARQKKDDEKVAKNEGAGAVSGRTAQSLPKLPAKARGARSDDSANRDKEKSAYAGETRSVGGRTFRREGNGWVDTAYNSSASVVNVRRGSEQFRSLIADEPGLKVISEQLSGTVIVVWKGRAYRIQ